MDEGYASDPVLSILNCGSSCPPACYCPLEDPSVCCCPDPGPPDAPECLSECACVAQMRNLLRQFIKVYAAADLEVALDSGETAEGRPYALLSVSNPNPNAGLFQLAGEDGSPREAVSICRIAAVRVKNAAYCDGLEYIAEPAEAQGKCGTDCLNAVRGLLKAGAEHVVIRAGGNTFGEGTVRKSEYGAAVLTGPDGEEPVFISICKAEIIML